VALEVAAVRKRPVLVIAVLAAAAFAQTPQPTNDLPNPYRTIENFLKMPEGRRWGSTSGVGVDRDGKSLWVAERCGANTCLDSKLDPILKFDANGTLVKSFGSGTMVFPHGLTVDRDGNIWVTDGQDNRPRRARGAPPDSPLPPAPATIIGHQVFKYSPDGKLLMTLGKQGGGRDAEYFYQPNAVAIATNGDIFVSEGHADAADAPARVLKFDKSGKFIKSWGKRGNGPGEFIQPHALAFDSKGRLFVGDRSNNRIQIFDQDGNYLAEWTQFSRPSGIAIDSQDTLYVADSESGGVNPAHGNWTRGIRIGSAKDGQVKALIPDPWPTCREGQRPTPEAPCAGPGQTSAAEGITLDPAGNIYGAEVGPRGVKKYVRK
jgi:DNA-binding beta-propeller fold protein YncE